MGGAHLGVRVLHRLALRAQLASEVNTHTPVAACALRYTLASQAVEWGRPGRCSCLKRCQALLEEVLTGRAAGAQTDFKGWGGQLVLPLLPSSGTMPQVCSQHA